ncbi:unnamed protein product [Heterobilharzia americana]|nr:unnamed protein product [Heterobilharzia americana]
MGDKLDLSSETLIGCTVERSGNHEKRFIVSYGQQLVLVEPDSKQLGWGVITFIGPLQDLESHCDPADSRCLHVTIHVPGHLTSQEINPGQLRNKTKPPIMVARFLFEDHIRCMTARQLLSRGKTLVEQTKLRKIASLLDFPPQFIREKFLISNTTAGGGVGASGGVSSMNYMYHSSTSNQYSVVGSNRLDSPSVCVSNTPSSRRIGSSLMVGTVSGQTQQQPLNREGNDNNNSGIAGGSVRSGDFLMDHRSHGNAFHRLRDRNRTDGPVPLVCLTGSTSSVTTTTATLSSSSNESAIKSHPLFISNVGANLSTEGINQEISQFTTTPTGVVNSLRKSTDEENEDRIIHISQPFHNSKSKISISDGKGDQYTSANNDTSEAICTNENVINKQSESNLLSTKPRQVDYSSDISDC